MNEIRQWLFQIVTAALLLVLIQSIMPNGTIKDLGRLLGGLVLFCVVIGPMTEHGGVLFETAFEDYTENLSEYDPVREITDKSLLQSIISQETSEYIVSEAAALGVWITAETTCVWEGNIPVPAEVTVRGRIEPQQRERISTMIEQDLAIAPENIRYEEIYDEMEY